MTIPAFLRQLHRARGLWHYSQHHDLEAAKAWATEGTEALAGFIRETGAVLVEEEREGTESVQKVPKRHKQEALL